MNGSKNVLLIIIFLMALLPWGFLVVLLNSEKGAELLGIEPNPAALSAEEAGQMEKLIEEQQAQIASLREELAAAPEDGEPLITLAELARLRDTLTRLEAENREARAEIERLRTEYNSALSEVVRLKTQQMAAEAMPKPAPQPEPTPAPAPQPPEQSRPEAAAPPADPAGWILPPSN